MKNLLLSILIIFPGFYKWQGFSYFLLLMHNVQLGNYSATKLTVIISFLSYYVHVKTRFDLQFCACMKEGSRERAPQGSGICPPFGSASTAVEDWLYSVEKQTFRRYHGRNLVGLREPAPKKSTFRVSHSRSSLCSKPWDPAPYPWDSGFVYIIDDSCCCCCFSWLIALSLLSLFLFQPWTFLSC